MQRKRYSAEFKCEAVKLAGQAGMVERQVAEELGAAIRGRQIGGEPADGAEVCVQLVLSGCNIHYLPLSNFRPRRRALRISR